MVIRRDDSYVMTSKRYFLLETDPVGRRMEGSTDTSSCVVVVGAVGVGERKFPPEKTV